MPVGLLGTMPAEQPDDVTFTRSELYAQAKKYNTITDCIEQNVENRGELYLSIPYTSLDAAENTARYASYLGRAIFYNATGRTLQGLVGQIYSRPPEVKMPPIMDQFVADATGRNVSLEQASKDLSNFVVAYGRAGVWVDYPKLEEQATQADIKTGRVKPVLTIFGPTNIINWREQMVGNRMRRTLIVTVEDEDAETEYSVATNRIYREMRLVGGVYQLKTWRSTGETKSAELGSTGSMVELHGWYTPTKADGTPFDEIPFAFCGSVNNDTNIDPAPLYDLAKVNIGHYRNSADFEEAAFICGQPTLVMTGLDESWVEDVMKNEPILLGSRRAIPLPVGGNAMLLQAAPNNLPQIAMEQKEKQMVALGAKLVENRQVRRTAQEAGQASASESSILSQCAKNGSACLTQVSMWAGMFMGADTTEIKFTLNTDFALNTLSQEERMALIADYQNGGISFTEYRDQLRRGGVATQDDAAVKAEIEAEQAKKDAAEITKQKALQPPAPVAKPGAI